MKSRKVLSATCLFFAILSVLIIFHPEAYAQDISACDEGPIHEAFLAPESGSLILDAVPLEPPRPITEQIPAMDDPQAEWISGYWAWQPQFQDFVWVSGVWRRPPPAHQWISGYWESFEEGWVWLRGFWSPVPLVQLTYIEIAPPDPIDENVAQAHGRDYFWMPGYWEFNPSGRNYLWVSGQWELFDPHWVFVPAHYLWRSDGYIFIPAYWDWPMETRGIVYSCVFIQPGVRAEIVYLPEIIIEYPVIIDLLFPYYPDYVCFFGHFHHHHPGFWDDFCCVPPWWGWDAWWSFSWHDQWALWWWWSHPGFPQPHWMNAQFSAMLPPPGQDLLAKMADIKGPGIITPFGVVKVGDLRKGLADVMGGKSDLLAPILPSKPQELDKVIGAIKPEALGEILKPTGKGISDLRQQAQKPTIPSTLPEGAVIVRPTVPQKPKTPIMRPPIRKPIRPPAVHPRPRETAPPSYAPVPERQPGPSYWPPGRRPKPPGDHGIPPSYEPRYPPRQPGPREEPPTELDPSWRPRPRPQQEPPPMELEPSWRPKPRPQQEPPTDATQPSYTPPLRMPGSFKPMAPSRETAPPSEIDTPMQTAPPPQRAKSKIETRRQQLRESRMQEYQLQKRGIEQQLRQFKPQEETEKSEK